MPESTVILETPRLLVRLMQPGDIDPLVALWTDPAVTKHMGGPRDREQLEGNLAAMCREASKGAYDLWPVVEKATGAVIGMAGLLEKDVNGRDAIELVYVLSKSVWGQGYATEIASAIREYAFSTLGLRRIVSLIHPENTASMRVAKKVGMEFEGEAPRPGGVTSLVYVSRVGMKEK